MGLRTFLQAKLHRATITGTEVDYEGSVAICPHLIEAAGLYVHERVDIYNVDNGERFSTYVIFGKLGEICLNGAAAHKGSPGQRVIIASYTQLAPEEIAQHKPTVVLVGEDNQIKDRRTS
ncbi:MAG: aspartate 1-decarboxylase [Desulfomicrobium sp.]|nr:aspartate 1-decarboxylase [Desulfomicrobium sp.]NLV95793.1 aspartate 1-decarboxylase [Desulfovibrionales bacterium]